MMKKTLQKVGIEGTHGNTIQAIYDKPTANITVRGEKLKAFPLRPGTGQGSPLSPLFKRSCGSPSYSDQRRKGIKGIQTGKENKRDPNRKRTGWAVTAADDTILHTENPEDATRKLLELINELGKVAGYKINTQKSVAFLYVISVHSELLF